MNRSSTALVVWCVDINAAPVPPSMGPRDLLAAVGFFGRVPALDARDEKPRRFSWEALSRSFQIGRPVNRASSPGLEAVRGTATKRNAD